MECSNCSCSSHQIIAAGGCPQRVNRAGACLPFHHNCDEGDTCPARLQKSSAPTDAEIAARIDEEHDGAVGFLRWLLTAVIVAAWLVALFLPVAK